MEIVREQFVLRPWRMTDCESLAANANSKRIWDNVRDFFPHPYTVDDAKAFIGEMVAQRRELCDFAITIDGNAVGGVGFVRGIDVERLSAELGYWLGEAYWNRGIMTDAVRAVADYVFHHTDIIRLFAPVFAYNQGSMRVLEKAGFTKLAVLHKAAIKNGSVVDMHYYELVK